MLAAAESFARRATALAVEHASCKAFLVLDGILQAREKREGAEGVAAQRARGMAAARALLQDQAAARELSQGMAARELSQGMTAHDLSQVIAVNRPSRGREPSASSLAQGFSRVARVYSSGLDDEVKAGECLKEALALKPPYPRLLLLELGASLCRSGGLEEGQRYLRRGLERRGLADRATVAAREVLRWCEG